MFAVRLHISQLYTCVHYKQYILHSCVSCKWRVWPCPALPGSLEHCASPPCCSFAGSNMLQLTASCVTWSAWDWCRHMHIVIPFATALCVRAHCAHIWMMVGCDAVLPSSFPSPPSSNLYGCGTPGFFWYYFPLPVCLPPCVPIACPATCARWSVPHPA